MMEVVIDGKTYRLKKITNDYSWDNLTVTSANDSLRNSIAPPPLPGNLITFDPPIKMGKIRPAARVKADIVSMRNTLKRNFDIPISRWRAAPAFNLMAGIKLLSTP